MSVAEFQSLPGETTAKTHAVHFPCDAFSRLRERVARPRVTLQHNEVGDFSPEYTSQLQGSVQGRFAPRARTHTHGSTMFLFL